ncbi:MAG: glutamine--fructose-6-phosphate transaminase (isomerizing) [Symbiobacteriia bacterium]
MCGIVGYIGDKPAMDFLIDGLRKLEYRGYDSAGVAVLGSDCTQVVKSAGRLQNLTEKVTGNVNGGMVGIGHTRWATHGRPSDENAHPHSDCTGNFVVVHNGIIENFLNLKQELMAKGHKFVSETDTEVIAHLIEELYDGDIEQTVYAMLGQLQGSYALAIMARQEPEKIIAVRQDSPLIVGLGQGENYLASDIPALLQHTREIYILNDGEVAILQKGSVRVTDRFGKPVKKDIFAVKWDPVAAEKGGYEHFMLKEIHEQPKAFRDTLTGRIAQDNSRVILDEVHMTVDQIKAIKKVAITACGTAYHAGLVAKQLLEKWVRLPVDVEVASEFRYRDPLIDDQTLLIVISQSGETADTLAALREGKRRGAHVVAVTNVVGSSVSREADDVIFTWAGPEIAVASTKAYTTQLIALTLLAAYLGQVRGNLAGGALSRLLAEMKTLPAKAEAILGQEEKIRELAGIIAKHEDVFFIGRGLDCAVALEGQLKLKEISYIHAEAYPAGELKHGTLALITPGVPVIALTTQESVYDKTISNIREVNAREAFVVGLGLEVGPFGADAASADLDQHVDYTLRIPRTEEHLVPALAVLPLQMLAYYAAVARGADVDKPRNLAKSVTVE